MPRALPIPESAAQYGTFVVGNHGSGKSEVIKQRIWHYLNQPTPQETIVVIDPHGQMAPEIARMKPNYGSDRLVYLDPTLDPAFMPCPEFLQSQAGDGDDLYKEAEHYGERPRKSDYMYYLTQRGLDEVYWAFEDEFLSALAQLPFDEIWLPTEKKKLTNEYFHRRAYVDTHIAFRRWAAQSGVQLDFITHDYQGDPNRPKLRGRPASINHVIWDERGQRRIKPDGLLGLTIGRVSRLFVLELHNESDTRLVVDQLYRNFAAANAILAKFPHYQTMSNPFVLSVYTRPEILAATQAQVLANSVFADVLPGLFFAHLDHLQSDFASAWHYANGQRVEMFDRIT